MAFMYEAEGLALIKRASETPLENMRGHELLHRKVTSSMLDYTSAPKGAHRGMKSSTLYWCTRPVRLQSRSVASRLLCLCHSFATRALMLLVSSTPLPLMTGLRSNDS